MKFLLDTHSLIWFFSGYPNLRDRVCQYYIFQYFKFLNTKQDYCY